MKYKKAKKKYLTLDLQLFADDVSDSGESAGADMDPDEGREGKDDPEDNPDEKKFSQKDMDDAVERRLAKEIRKWKRQQEAGSGHKAGDADDGGADSGDVKALRAAEDRACGLEVKVACYEAGVAKDAVEDVAALAKSYMASNKGLDLEEAIEKVVKKYPQFKGEYEGGGDDDRAGRRKGWGERHKSPAKPGKTVDDELREQLFGK